MNKYADTVAYKKEHESYKGVGWRGRGLGLGNPKIDQSEVIRGDRPKFEGCTIQKPCGGVLRFHIKLDDVTLYFCVNSHTLRVDNRELARARRS